MLSSRCTQELDQYFYHILMKIHKDSVNHSKAEKLLTLMLESGVKPTIATMHMLMVSYVTAEQPHDAEVLNNIKSSNLELSTLPYSFVIDAYYKNGDYNQGIDKMLEMRRDGIEADHRICLLSLVLKIHQGWAEEATCVRAPTAKEEKVPQRHFWLSFYDFTPEERVEGSQC